MFNPWLILAVVLSWGIAFASGWKVRGDHEKAQQYDAALAYAAAYESEVERSHSISAQADKDIAAARAKGKAREAKLRKELKNATYRNTLLPDAGRMLLNAAARDARSAATGQSVEPVPDAGGSGKPGDDGRSLEVRNRHDRPLDGVRP